MFEGMSDDMVLRNLMFSCSGGIFKVFDEFPKSQEINVSMDKGEEGWGAHLESPAVVSFFYNPGRKDDTVYYPSGSARMYRDYHTEFRPGLRFWNTGHMCPAELASPFIYCKYREFLLEWLEKYTEMKRKAKGYE